MLQLMSLLSNKLFYSSMIASVIFLHMHRNINFHLSSYISYIYIFIFFFRLANKLINILDIFFFWNYNNKKLICIDIYFFFPLSFFLLFFFFFFLMNYIPNIWQHFQTQMLHRNYQELLSLTIKFCFIKSPEL